jgi:hypothetical protein
MVMECSELVGFLILHHQAIRRSVGDIDHSLLRTSAGGAVTDCSFEFVPGDCLVCRDDTIEDLASAGHGLSRSQEGAK